MRIFQATLFLFLLTVLLSPAAGAESPYKGGMNYTAMKKYPAPQETGENVMRHKTLTAQPRPDVTEEETPASRVWKKYKALAAGTYAEEKSEAGETAPAEAEITGKKEETPGKPAEAAKAPDPVQGAPRPSGFAAIIEQYHQNKAERSEMHTLRIIRPEVQSVARPEAPAAPVVK